MDSETALQRSSGIYISFAFYSFQYVFEERHAKLKIKKRISRKRSMLEIPDNRVIHQQKK